MKIPFHRGAVARGASRGRLEAPERLTDILLRLRRDALARFRADAASEPELEVLGVLYEMVSTDLPRQ